MKKLLFLAFVTLALLVPAFSSVTQIAGDEANAIVQAHEQISGKNQTNKEISDNETDDDSNDLTENKTEKPELTKSERQLALVAKFAASNNTNSVRIAVHTLLAMENRSGGIGKQISAIAREFDNSKNVTDAVEAKIGNGSRLRRFFLGGDTISADKIESEVAKNTERIAKLNALIAKCTDCTAEDTAVLQEMITKLEQENTRLQTLATAEKRHKGIFSWLKRK